MDQFQHGSVLRELLVESYSSSNDKTGLKLVALYLRKKKEKQNAEFHLPPRFLARVTFQISSLNSSQFLLFLATEALLPLSSSKGHVTSN
jgi:hypothetical protein